MVLKLGDLNEECKERVLKMLDGSAPPEISATVANYRASIANASSVHIIERTIANRLRNNSESFRSQCMKAVEDMRQAHLDRIMKKKGWEENDSEESDQGFIARFSYQRKHSLSGWHVAPYDPNQLTAMFQCLRLRDGYHLESYQGQDKDGNGNAIIFAVPDNRTLPKKPPQEILRILLMESLYPGWHVSDNIPKWRKILSKIYHSMMGIFFPSYRSLPKWANQDIESYIEGDSSPLSYFQASLFLREINELGSMWHALYWTHHALVTAPENLPDKEWTWHEPVPKYWSPIVWKDEAQRWHVTFYTLDDKDADLVFHNDTFTKGYQFETFSTSLAHYPGGYVV